MSAGHSHSHGHVDAAARKKKDDDAPDATAAAGPMKVHGWLNLVADFAHNFTDGLAIGE